MFLRYTECQLEEGSSVGFVCRGMVQVASGLFYGVKEIRGFAETLVSSTEGKAVPPAKSKYNEQRLEKLEVVAVKMMEAILSQPQMPLQTPWTQLNLAIS